MRGLLNRGWLYLGGCLGPFYTFAEQEEVQVVSTYKVGRDVRTAACSSVLCRSSLGSGRSSSCRSLYCCVCHVYDSSLGSFLGGWRLCLGCESDQCECYYQEAFHLFSVLVVRYEFKIDLGYVFVKVFFEKSFRKM